MNRGASTEEERYMQIQKDFISTLYSQKNAEKGYLSALKKLLDYWKSELETVDAHDKKRNSELLKSIEREESTIKKIMQEINRINEMIEQTEENSKKIQEMFASSRKNR